MPNEDGIDPSVLKKQLLFFDSVKIVNGADKCLVHKGEVQDNKGELNRTDIENDWHRKYPFVASTWNDTVPYLRNRKYRESINLILLASKVIQDKGFLSVVHTKNSAKVNHLLNWHAYNQLASSEAMVRAAIPDYKGSIPELELHNDGKPTIENVIDAKSIYNTFGVHPCTLDNIEFDWCKLAWSRIARYVKSYQLSYAYNSFPISTDEINISLANKIYAPKTLRQENEEVFLAQHVSLDVFDGNELLRMLDDMSWNEVIKLRKEILPKAKRLRSYLISEVTKRARSSGGSQAAYQQEMARLMTEFEKRKEDYADEWEKLRILSIFKSGGVVGGGVIANGANLIAIPKTLSEFIIMLTGAGLLAGAALSKELSSYIPKRMRYIKHPLHFTEAVRNKSAT